MRARPRAAWLAALVLVTACGSEDPATGSGGDPVAADSTGAVATPVGPAEHFERAFAFVSARSDSVLSMVWASEAESRPTEVFRRARGSVHFAGNWQELHRSAVATEPSPNPWRIVPDDVLRLIVDAADGVQEIFFSGGAPAADLVLGETLNEWNSAAGGAFLLSEGRLSLGERVEDGYAIDLTRAWDGERDRPAGDWALLVSGDSIAVFLEAPSEGSETWQAWARRDFESYGWPEVTVTWGAVQAFDRARRDVPVSWTLTTPDGDLSGILDLRSTNLEAGDGEGPLLPVDGFFDVAGRLVLGGIEIPVRGLIRHQQR